MHQMTQNISFLQYQIATVGAGTLIVVILLTLLIRKYVTSLVLGSILLLLGIYEYVMQQWVFQAPVTVYLLPLGFGILFVALSTIGVYKNRGNHGENEHNQN